MKALCGGYNIRSFLIDPRARTQIRSRPTVNTYPTRVEAGLVNARYTLSLLSLGGIYSTTSGTYI